MNLKKRKLFYRAIAVICAVFVLMLVSIMAIDNWQKDHYPESRGTGTEEFMQEGTVSWNGAQYKKKPALTTLLIAGIDRDMTDLQGVGTSRYRSGGQADFLLLLVIDPNDRKIHQLHIDRDTMTEVTVLSTYGQETGTRVMQICLSHNYGANKEENARYTVRAVRGLMKDLDIDGYYMLDYSAVGLVNEALGGVTVTIPDDMTGVNPSWEAGSVVTLLGGEAELFVRARKTAGEGTNQERMQRQSEFLTSATDAVRERISQDSMFGSQLLSSLKRNTATNLSDQQLLEELQKLATYEILDAEYLDGEYTIGDSDYMEYHIMDGSVERWVMTTYYEKQA